MKQDNGNLVVDVEFKYDLYDSDGKSNRYFFESIIEKIVKLEKANFKLTDERKKIVITVEYNKNTEEYIYKINGMLDYFSKTDGDVYKELRDSKIVERNNKIHIASEELSKLSIYNMQFGSMKLEGGIELDDGYISYKDDSIRVKRASNKVNNIIFTKNYIKNVYDNIKVSTSLEEVQKILGDSVFGSVKEGYLGYRGEYVYTFFYEDEISAHDYIYSEDRKFNYYLEEYITSGNLKKFAEDVRTHRRTYDIYEFDETNQNLHMTYPSYGVEINIVDNDSRGIIIYNNCYISDIIEKYIRDGKITFKNDDYLHITEQNRKGM